MTTQHFPHLGLTKRMHGSPVIDMSSVTAAIAGIGAVGLEGCVTRTCSVSQIRLLKDCVATHGRCTIPRQETREGDNGVTSVRFAWNPMLVDLRREICPRAQWQKNGRQWIMSGTEADTFVRAAQAGLDFGKSLAQIRVDNVIWVVGFVRALSGVALAFASCFVRVGFAGGAPWGRPIAGVRGAPGFGKV